MDIAGDDPAPLPVMAQLRITARLSFRQQSFSARWMEAALKTIGIVQARLGSTRLQGKMARKLGGRSLLEWVVRRVTDCERLDRVVVATGDEADNVPVRELVPRDVAVVTGSESDVLGRFVDVLDIHPADAVVRVCADNPFIDPALIDRMVVAADDHPGCDYISYVSSAGRPVILSSVGLYAEWCRADALRRADCEATDALDREHVTRYLYSRPELFNLRLLPTPSELDRDDVRLTVDFEEDWQHAQEIFDALGAEALDWQQIARLLDTQPAMRERMAELNRKHAKV
jgi:spore coat polysaccharide biosynthesis protein SpsF